MRTLTTLLISGAALSLAVLASAAPASAREYPWCADYSGGRGGGGTNCGFVSFEQCRATVFGVGGTCRRNAFFDARAQGDWQGDHARRYRERNRW